MNSSTPRIEFERVAGKRGWQVHINRVNSSGMYDGVVIWVPDEGDWRVLGPLVMAAGVEYTA